jgi:predicted negative regulator of RcsB-dependent stress response
MPTAPPPPRDVALETRVFWERFKGQIVAIVVVVAVTAVGFVAYRAYTDRQSAAASALLARSKSAQDYQDVIARYSHTAAGADAYLLLAEAQRREGKFADADATLQVFITKNPNHEFVSTARMAIAANLESMGKTDEALSTYQQVASLYQNSFNAPLALLSQVYLLKAKNRMDEARRVCENILTQYRTSFWAGEAAQELRLLSISEQPASASRIPPLLTRPPTEGSPSTPTPGGQKP